MIGKQHHVTRFGDSRQMQLLRIAVHTHLDTTCIYPSTTIITRTQILKIADDIIAQIILQMLGTAWITRLSTCPDAIKDLGSILQIKAEPLEMVIPVGVFDDHLHLRIHSFRRTYHQIPCSIIHQLQTILRPGLITFGFNLNRTLTTGEEKVVEQELIEMPRCRLGNLLYHLPMFRIRVAERLKLIALVNGKSNTTCHLDALFQEELLGFLKRCIIYNQHVTMCLQIDLIHIQLAGDGCPR